MLGGVLVFDGVGRRRLWGLAAGRFGRVDDVAAAARPSLRVGRGPRETHAPRRHRECLDKYLPRVKIFEYANDGGHK